MDIKIRDFEITILKSLRGISSSFLDSLMQIITMLGEEYVLIGVIAIFYFLYDKEIGKKIIFTLFVSLLLNNTLKGLIKYPRPFVYDPSLDAVRKETATGFSFPSGHTQSATTLYSSVAMFGNLDKKTKLSKKTIWIIAIIIFTLVGFSRMYLAVHYPKDVIVGVILGIASVFLCSYLFKLSKDDSKKLLIIHIIIFAIFLPFLFIFYKDSYLEIKIYKNFYSSFAMYSGFILANLIDNKFVNFTCNTSLKKKILRLFGVVICFAIIQFGLKLILPSESIFFYFLRYFLLTFVSLGIYPLAFKNNLFKD